MNADRAQQNMVDAPECKVSVLCATFNHEDYLRQTLDSFVAQKTDFPFEVLVNDDASTDHTAEILREYADRYPDIIRPFYQDENLYSRRMNVYDLVFFPAARGKYIALCEGDDYWNDPEKLQRQTDWLDAHPDYSACVHNSIGKFSDQPDRVLFAQDGDRDIPFEQVINGMSHAYHTSSILARREFILNPPDYRNVAYEKGYFTDYAIGVRLCLEGKVRFLDRCMSVYRIGSNPSAWSKGVGQEYSKLTRFVSGEIAMLETLKSHELTPEQKAAVDRVILEREYELLYLQGRVEEMVKPPYDQIHRSMGTGHIVSTQLKRMFPRLHRLYRKNRGYGDSE
ncbi:MAG: glycosyltransferase [Oscillospiraceae bacterium]|nr:glycosyltransferase [Oscillospiraceae bacterium]